LPAVRKVALAGIAVLVLVGVLVGLPLLCPGRPPGDAVISAIKRHQSGDELPEDSVVLKELDVVSEDVPDEWRIQDGIVFETPVTDLVLPRSLKRVRLDYERNTDAKKYLNLLVVGERFNLSCDLNILGKQPYFLPGEANDSLFYQDVVEGLMKGGLSPQEAKSLVLRAVDHIRAMDDEELMLRVMQVCRADLEDAKDPFAAAELGVLMDNRMSFRPSRRMYHWEIVGGNVYMVYSRGIGTPDFPAAIFFVYDEQHRLVFTGGFGSSTATPGTSHVPPAFIKQVLPGPIKGSEERTP